MTTVTPAFPGETLDQVCRRVFGDESGYVEAVLAANPGLAALPKHLPLGTRLVLPRVIAAARTADPVVKLWD